MRKTGSKATEYATLGAWTQGEHLCAPSLSAEVSADASAIGALSERASSLAEPLPQDPPAAAQPPGALLAWGLRAGRRLTGRWHAGCWGAG